MSIKVDVALVMFGFVAYLVDVSLDCTLAYSHSSQQDWNWMGWTIFLILLPGVVNGALTCLTILSKTVSDYSFQTKCVGVTMSSFMLGPLFWDVNSLHNLRKAKTTKSKETASGRDEQDYMHLAHDSMKMGTIERGVEAACESIPQWTAQIYIIGITNRITFIQLASLASSVLGATYCVIEATRAFSKTWAEHRGRSNRMWDLSFVLFGIWMILAMMAYLITVALFSAANSGAYLFLLLPFFHVYVFGQFFLFSSWKDKKPYKGKTPQFFQRVSILAQIAVCLLTFFLILQWRPTTNISIQVHRKLTKSNESHIMLGLEEGSLPPITLGLRDKKYQGPGRVFSASVEFATPITDGNKTTLKNIGNNSEQKCKSDCENELSYFLRLTLREDFQRNTSTTRFLANICDEKSLKMGDIGVSNSSKLIGTFEALTKKEVYCLSNISDSMVWFLLHVDCIWLCYHILLVISMDWLFLAGDETEEEAPTNVHQAMDVYVNQAAL